MRFVSHIRAVPLCVAFLTAMALGQAAEACSIKAKSTGVPMSAIQSQSFQSAELNAFDGKLADEVQALRDGISGSRNLTRATDDRAIGRTRMVVERHNLPAVASRSGSCASALSDMARQLQENDIAETPVSYPKDTPTVEVSKPSGVIDTEQAFLIWEPRASDGPLLSRFAKSFAEAHREATGLKTYVVFSQSWAIQHSGIALVDEATGEALWYGFRTFRALVSRRG